MRPERTTTVIRKKRGRQRCDIAAHVVMSGSQEVKAEAHTANTSLTGSGYISLRVGRCLLLIEDQEALLAWLDALSRAEKLAARAFAIPTLQQQAS